MNGERLSNFVGQPDRPLIIGGCPRSGTTLLRTMLQAGPEVAIPRETRFVLEAWRERRRFGDLRDADNRRRLAGDGGQVWGESYQPSFWGLSSCSLSVAA